MYLSPFHLIDPAIFENDADVALIKRRLGLEKRKLMAEFELAGTPAISYQGREIHKQRLTQLFDELQDPASLQLHLQIWRSSSFLSFLESAETDTGATWLHLEQASPEITIRRRISAFYAAALDQYLRNCLRSPAAPWPDLRRLSHDPWLMGSDEHTAFHRTIRFYIDKNSELLRIRHRSESGGEVFMNHVYEWCSEAHLQLLNELPRYFEYIRYRLADRLNNLCVYFDQMGQRRTALAAIQQAATIRVDDEELSRLIPSNLRLLQEKTHVYAPPKPPSPQPEPSQQWLTGAIWAVIWGVVIIWLLARAAGCTG